jgi:hypothetical protein
MQRLDDKGKQSLFVFWLHSLEESNQDLEKILRIWNTTLFVNFRELIAKQDFFSEVLLSSGRLLAKDDRNRMLLVKLLRRLALVKFEEQSLFLAIWNSSNFLVAQSCLEVALQVSDGISGDKENDMLLLIVYAFSDQPRVLALVLAILTEMDIRHRWIYYARIFESFPHLTEILAELLKNLPFHPKLSAVVCLLSFLVNRNLPGDVRIPSSLEVDGILFFILIAVRTSDFTHLLRFIQSNSHSFRRVCSLLNWIDLLTQNSILYNFIQLLTIKDSKRFRRTSNYLLVRACLQFPKTGVDLSKLDVIQRLATIELPEPVERAEMDEAALKVAEIMGDPIDQKKAKNVWQALAEEKEYVKRLLRHISFSDELPSREDFESRKIETAKIMDTRRRSVARQPLRFVSF